MSFVAASTSATPLVGRVRSETVRVSLGSPASGSSSLLSTSMVTAMSSSVVASSRTASGASFTSVTVISTEMLSLALEGSVAVTVTK